MNVTIIRNSKNLTAETIHEIRLSVGWTSSISNCGKELNHTYSNFTAWDADICIGYVNAISDGVSDALIHNLIVRPQYQNSGVGSKLIATLVSELRNDGVKFFNIVFEERLSRFYKKQGFKLMSAGIMDFCDLSEVVAP